MINGETGFIKLNAGIGLHYSNVTETEDCEHEDIATPGVSITLLLEGQVKFYLDGCPYYLGRPDTNAKYSVACGKIWSQTEPMKFCRVFKKGQKVKKIVISLQPNWLKKHGFGEMLPGAPSDLDKKINEFIKKDNYNKEWLLCPRAISVAEEIIHPPYESKSMKRILRECRSMELLLLALTSFSNSYNNEVPEMPKVEQCRLVKIHSYIEENFHHNLTLDEIAQHAGLSVSSLQRHFKKAYGATVVEHIRNRKLSFAKKLIDENNMSITEAALQVGYTTPSSFTTAFKRVYGCTPTSS